MGWKSRATFLTSLLSTEHKRHLHTGQNDLSLCRPGSNLRLILFLSQLTLLNIHPFDTFRLRLWGFHFQRSERGIVVPAFSPFLSKQNFRHELKGKWVIEMRTDYATKGQSTITFIGLTCTKSEKYVLEASWSVVPISPKRSIDCFGKWAYNQQLNSKRWDRSFWAG